MAKRKPLSFDDKELSENLGRSAKGIDAFFSPTVAPDKPQEVPAEEKVESTGKKPTTAKKATKKKKSAKSNGDDTVVPRHHGTMQPFNHDTMVSRYQDGIIQTVRRAVKEIGKEAATHRFTEKEKQEIIDLIYAYKRQGITTSENEITRIAVNFLVQDYQQNGETSILHQVLKALKD